MTTAPVVETSVTVNNSPIHDYVHPDDYSTYYEMTFGFTPFTDEREIIIFKIACLPPSITPNVTTKKN